MERLNALKSGKKGLLTAFIIGAGSLGISGLTGIHILDPLLTAMVIGTALKSFVKFDEAATAAFRKTPSLLIPAGVIFYGAVNLDLVRFTTVDASLIFILSIVFIVYILSALILSNALGLNDRMGYLIATGSAICGASAIAITSDAIEAEPDEVSNSLIPVFIAALIGLFIVLPLLDLWLGISDMDYGVFAGTVLQFTGFVKTAAADLSRDVQTTALSVKALRYIGLLFLLPLFASFTKGRLHIPWYLWGFLAAGLLFSFLPGPAAILRPYFKFILDILWCTAMAAIGLNADIKTLLTKTGLKAFAASLASFLIAVVTFLAGFILL